MRVCFVAYHALPLFDPNCRTPIGGAETHAWLLATGLAQRSDYDVHVVVQAPVPFRRSAYGNVTVWNLGTPLDTDRRFVSDRVDVLPHWPWLRVRRWHPSLLWKIPKLAIARGWQRFSDLPLTAENVYDEMEPDVLCCFGVSGQAATAIRWARDHNARSLLFLESNNDLDERFTADSTYVTPYGETGATCHFVLEAADRIIAQTAVQQQLLIQRRDRDASRMPNAVDLRQWDDRIRHGASILADFAITAPFVLWIGRADRFHKRPELCLQLARQLPEIPFVMVLNRGDDDIERHIRGEALPNVTIIPQIPFEQMPAVMSSAALFLSTGSAAYEGAPNVFLQAAASGIPVLSLEVTTEVLDESGCGIVCDGNMERLASELERLWNDPAARQQLGQRGRRYIEQHCDLPIVVDQLVQQLDDVSTTSNIPGPR